MTETHQNGEQSQPIAWGALTVDVARRGLTLDGAAIQLTPTEWSVLLALLSPQGAVIMPDELLRRVWGDTFGAGRDYVHVYINRLRRKLEQDPTRPQLIVTEQGGYRLVREPTAAPERDDPTRPALPVDLTSFVGREAELAAIRTLIQQPTTRLLTLTGASGAGKTRLALEAVRPIAHLWPHGAMFVPLAALSEAAQVLPAIAQAIGGERRGRNAAELLRRQLQERTCLLVLDNFEHVRAAAPALVELLGYAPNVSLLVTSRARLNVRGEHEYEVEPLPLPRGDAAQDHATLSGNPAVGLFAARARAVDSRFALSAATSPQIAAICRKLDGLPLAIELAAARTNVLPLDELLTRLDDRLGLLRGGPQDLPHHQQTLRGALDWSYALLDAGPRRVLALMGVFGGGCTLEALEALAEGDAAALLDDLTTLVEHHLVRREAGAAGARFGLLETIREYALEQLGTWPDRDAVHARHAAYFSRLARAAGQQLQGKDQLRWLGRLDDEHPNLVAALTWLIDHGRTAEAVEMAEALDVYWMVRGRADEARAWLEAALAQTGAETTVRASGLLSLAINELYGGDRAAALPHFEEALRIYQRLEDEDGIAAALNHSGAALLATEQRAAGLARLEASRELYRAQGHLLGTACVQSKISLALMEDGKLEHGLAQAQEALAMLAEVGDRVDTAGLTGGMGRVLLADGQVDAAVGYLERSSALYAELGATERVIAVRCLLAQAELTRRAPERARAHLLQASRAARSARSTEAAPQILVRLAAATAELGQYSEAARLLGGAAAAMSEPGAPFAAPAVEERSAAEQQIRARLGAQEWRQAFDAGQRAGAASLLAELADEAASLAH